MTTAEPKLNPGPDELAEKIFENLEAELNSFWKVLTVLLHLLVGKESDNRCIEKDSLRPKADTLNKSRPEHRLPVDTLNTTNKSVRGP